MAMVSETRIRLVKLKAARKGTPDAPVFYWINLAKVVSVEESTYQGEVEECMVTCAPAYQFHVEGSPESIARLLMDPPPKNKPTRVL